jgi:hypothetical protein
MLKKMSQRMAKIFAREAIKDFRAQPKSYGTRCASDYVRDQLKGDGGWYIPAAATCDGHDSRTVGNLATWIISNAVSIEDDAAYEEAFAAAIGAEKYDKLISMHWYPFADTWHYAMKFSDAVELEVQNANDFLSVEEAGAEA